MSNHSFAYAHKDTIGGANMDVSTVGAKWGGFILNGSVGSSTITIKDGAVVLYVTSAGANQVITVNYQTPIACTTSLLATCSGTGYYSVFLAA